MTLRTLALVPVASLVAAAATTAGAATAKSPCSSGQVMKTKSYVFALTIGPVEKMYTTAQVAAQHPKTGEVMLSGKMTSTGGMSGMDMGSSTQRHLEVHICTPAGRVVAGAHPTISVDDLTASTMTMKVTIAVMEGVSEGASDLHYGNNVNLMSGHHIAVAVTLNGEKALFTAVVSKT
jgi:hypothetical protein